MIDAEDLACRYLHLWQDYLTALMAHLRSLRLLQPWSLPTRRLQEIPRRVTPPRSRKPGCPDRWSGAAPLPMRLASATTLLLTPRAVSLPSNVSGRQLHFLTAEIDALGPEPVEGAVEAEIAHRSERYLAGL
jgi:hypothetical protein